MDETTLSTASEKYVPASSLSLLGRSLSLGTQRIGLDISF
jgi:hypothetical protein